MKTLLVIDNATLNNMLNRQDLTNEFAFLRAHSPKFQKVAKTCCGKKNRRKAAEYQKLKRTIAQLGPARKKKLKELLRTKQIRVKYPNGSGKVIELTF